MEKLTNKNLPEFIDNYPTKYPYGFIASEIVNILEEYNIDKTKFYAALGVNTCMIFEGQTITYHCDVLKGLSCVLEDRNQTFEEWD
jgi:hypothetical protein